jgi:two-component system, sensor histidine kinase and response regulator
VETIRKVRAFSFHQRILLLTMLTTGAGLVLVSAGYIILDVHTEKLQKSKQLAISAELIGTSLAAAVDFDYPESADRILGAIRSQPGIHGAALYTTSGKILAVYNRTAFTPPVQPKDGEVWTRDVLKLTAPVMLEQRRVGTIYLETDLKDLLQRTSQFELLTIKVGLIMLLLVYIVTSVLVRSITQPIEKLAALTRTIAIAREYGLRAPLIGGRELRYLAADFNQMLSEIQRNERALMESRDTLELRVAERTKELEQEIVERRKAEESLRVSEEQLRTLSEAAPVGIFRTSLNGGAGYANPALLNLLGLDSESATGLGWMRAIHPEDGEYLRRLRTEAMESGREYSASFRVLRKDGSIRLAELHAKPTRMEAGNVVNREGRMGAVETIAPRRENNSGGFVGIVQDVTERVKREEELKRSEERFRTLSAVAPVGIVLLCEEGKVSYVNEHYLRMTGLTEEEALRDEWQEITHPDDLEDLRRARHAAIATKADSYGMSYRYLRKDNRIVWVDAMARAFQQKEGGERGYVVVIQDVTERHRSEERLRAAKEAAESANKAKSDFLANMSHEIRTPMNGILGMTELALDTELMPEQREYLDMVRTSAEALLAIINDILDFSKIEAGRMELETATFSLEDCIEAALGPLGVRAMKKGLDLTWSTEGTIPEALKGDSTRLRQILINLVGNAIKFTKEGEVAVWASRVSGDDSKVKIRFVVSDTGIGIPSEKHEQIFEAFSQADTSTTREFGGTGLGLSISAQLVRLMGGEIGLESAPGMGSKFHFTAVFDEAKADSKILRELAGLKNKPVLVVDDNEVNRHLLQKLLGLWGMKPVLASGGMAGIQEYERSVQLGEPYPLVLLDVNMPVIDGYGVAARLRELAPAEKTVILALSSSFITQTSNAPDSLKIGRKLNKPIRRAELRDAIAELMEKPETKKEEQTTEGRPKQRKLRLLLVEDNQVNQKLATRLLEKMGHEVKLAANGKDAVELCAAEVFDLVLMDIQMPVMGGMEATARIREREQEKRGRVPILAMTAHAMKSDEERCLAGGMDGYISKPIHADFLRKEIFRLTEKETDAASEKSKENRPNPAGERPAVNMQELLARVENDWDLLRELAAIFRDDFPRYANNLRQAIENKDLAQAAEAAHAMKGMLFNLASSGAAEAAREIEHMARGGGAPDFSGPFAKLEFETKEMLEEFKSFLTEA